MNTNTGGRHDIDVERSSTTLSVVVVIFSFQLLSAREILIEQILAEYSIKKTQNLK